MDNKVSKKTIDEAAVRIDGNVKHTPLQFSKRLSEKFGAKIYIKREDLQDVRSYKIRGAFNLMTSLTEADRKKGVVCASAGNHAQGVAYSCAHLKIKGVIFMPIVTPLQKINRVREFGGKYAEVKLVGQTFDDACDEALVYAEKNGAVFVHPFGDPRVISGQGTVAREIYEKLDSVDYCFVPIGGGGLISGVSTYFKDVNPKIKIIGAEPKGAPAMFVAFKEKKIRKLPKIDKFIDGAAVAQVSKQTYEIASKLVKEIKLIPEGKVCTTMIELYQNEGVVAEPAGALSIAALDFYAKEIKGKTVVCILSGGNNDITRYPEIMERSLQYEGLKHYFLVQFAQKPGQLREFLNKALGPTDDIVRFEYIKKTSKEMGPALIGVEFQKKTDYPQLVTRMKRVGLQFTNISAEDMLANYLI